VRTVAVLLIAQAVSELAFSFALPFLPLYIQELGVPDVSQAGLWAGVMAGAFAIMMGTMGPVWGMVADRYGRKLMIQRALFGGCLFIGAMGLVQTPVQLLVLRMLQGSVTGVVAAMAVVVSLSAPRHRLGATLGMMQAAMFVGTAFGPVVGGVFSDTFGYRAAFAATAVLFLACALLVTFFVREPTREPAEQVGGGVSFRDAARELLSRPELVAAIGLMAIVRFASTAPQPVLPLFIQQMVEDRTTLATQAGIVVAATGTASLVSALAVGHLSDRYGRRLSLLVCLLTAALLCPPHLLVTTVAQLVVLRLAMGLALGGLFPAIQAMLTDFTPSGRRGMAFGLLATASAIGNGAGPVLGSVVASGYGAPSVFVAVTPVFLLGAVLVLRLPSPRSRAGG
jgi:DHA1 family multidrug resistance protein-like MFS transporter